MMTPNNNDNYRRPVGDRPSTFAKMDGFSEDRKPQLNEVNMPSSQLADTSNGPTADADTDWVFVPERVNSEQHGLDYQRHTLSTDDTTRSVSDDTGGRCPAAPLGEGIWRPGLGPALALGDPGRLSAYTRDLALADLVSGSQEVCPWDVRSWVDAAAPAFGGGHRHKRRRHVSSSMGVPGKRGPRTHISDASSAFAPVNSPATNGVDIGTINAVGAWSDDLSFPPMMYYNNSDLELDQ
ncbi:hypothetical protein NKR23_g592 [Pleurostoma richardsiae]|uniref:Uncharacterized protein n=1 Tax=Pleurostoma richardsiae TaxID=41990 RepID=A0AA38RSQ4_9PEZI|nr:hypothetical protein NKR23_g592 [Pleurostoma richardsiae]